MKKFDLKKHYADYPMKNWGDIRYAFECVRPYFDECALVSDEDKYILAQINANVIANEMRNHRISSERDVIMKRLRQEEADRLYNGDVNKLHLYYPHHLVDDEYLIRSQWWMNVCELDVGTIRRANAAAGMPLLREQDTYHVESMLGYFDELRFRLKRKYLTNKFLTVK